MASSKKPTYKVEMKLATERKRRKSDLVIMWQSIWDVTMTILNELWIMFIGMWEFVRLWFSSSERLLIEAWLEKYLPFVPDDFSESWRDGRLLAILINKLKPGCFPDANRLDPDYGLKNVYRVFDALEIYFGIKPNVSVEEIVTCIDGSDLKLLEILLELKNLVEKPENQIVVEEPKPKEKTDESGQWQSSREVCVAKGTGLAVGFIGKITTFSIFCAVMSDLDVVVQIRGPNSVCSERITKRSPKKKRPVYSWECIRPLTRSASYDEDNDVLLINEEDENFENNIIPLEYEISGNQISLCYKPMERGEHKITILWHGQHISTSPYFVTIEDPSKLTGINNVIHLKPVLKTTSEFGKNELFEKARKISVRFQESEPGLSRKERTKRCGKILSRRVLRYIVKIHGKDIPVNAENTESLATELLKMDYDFEKSPSFHRRNSWGCTGDAERKKSVIRQFCIDVNELDAQISQRRSRSLSLTPGSKKLIQKSVSFDSLTSNLNIVDEDVFENSEEAEEKEEDYAYINADLVNETNQINTVKCNNEEHTNMGNQAHKLSSQLIEGECVESLKLNENCEGETGKISSLSTDKILKERVDNTDADLPSNIPPCSPVLKFHADEVNQLSFNCQRPDVEIHHEEKIHEKTKNNSKSSEHSQRSNNSQIMKGSLKINSYRNYKYDRSRPLKKYKRKKRIGNLPNQVFCRKASRNTNSIYLTSISNFKKCQGNIQMLKTKKNLSPKVFENLRIKDTVKSKRQRSENKNYELFDDAQNVSGERLNISHLTEDVTNNIKDTPFINERHIKSTEQKELTIINHSRRNITHDEAKAKSICKASEGMVQELKTKKMDLNPNLNMMPASLSNLKDMNVNKTKRIQTSTPKPTKQFFIDHDLNMFPTYLTESEVEAKDANVERVKPLRTHTLKIIEQLNFKQFNPYFEAQSNISPVKLQIGHWESTLSSERENDSSQNTCTVETEQVSVKEKLAFWENACKTEQKSLNRLENNRKTNLVRNKAPSIEDNSDAIRKDIHTVPSTGNKSSTLVSVIVEKMETCNSINKKTNLAAKTRARDKISTEFQLAPQKFNRRSFSDPVILEIAACETSVPVETSCLESPRQVQSSCSSTEDNSELYESGESEDSGGDYILHSTEDEYIDDEISERASEYWGDLSLGKGWKVMRNEYLPSEEEFLQNYQRNKSYPEACKVFGIAVYYGHVAIKNRFRVYTGDAGFGNLSVSMQGFRQHDVSLVSVAYVRNDIYEVTYQVMTPGYYLISIRWMDKEIPGSPFVCKVTF